ncbi:uncharacterized protein SCODWIG_01117 [Saccharomycodes ludwigii]|uniref:Protein transport protein SEC23 n=1 Tax=Saccharomycodes ludwigii TaxID=36035 RepID=A0A376B3U6_9ASCO|nr:hypothetical protein SCDLUD_004615 [Saccharomycodes ludwigii]KAH3899186.1 hypothetical protein SCDLUD_004615 [Saccharomycodes ludwigii]SSD59356.1 uncharacterized protein SCODWIG_01117 [Saccharomycodes ludwigii]
MSIYQSHNVFPTFRLESSKYYPNLLNCKDTNGNINMIFEPNLYTFETPNHNDSQIKVVNVDQFIINKTCKNCKALQSNISFDFNNTNLNISTNWVCPFCQNINRNLTRNLDNDLSDYLNSNTNYTLYDSCTPPIHGLSENLKMVLILDLVLQDEFEFDQLKYFMTKFENLLLANQKNNELVPSICIVLLGNDSKVSLHLTDTEIPLTIKSLKDLHSSLVNKLWIHDTTQVHMIFQNVLNIVAKTNKKNSHKKRLKRAIGFGLEVANGITALDLRAQSSAPSDIKSCYKITSVLFGPATASPGKIVSSSMKSTIRDFKTVKEPQLLKDSMKYYAQVLSSSPEFDQVIGYDFIVCSVQDIGLWEMLPNDKCRLVTFQDSFVDSLQFEMDLNQWWNQWYMVFSDLQIFVTNSNKFQINGCFLPHRNVTTDATVNKTSNFNPKLFVSDVRIEGCIKQSKFTQLLHTPIFKNVTVSFYMDTLSKTPKAVEYGINIGNNHNEEEYDVKTRTKSFNAYPPTVSTQFQLHYYYRGKSYYEVATIKNPTTMQFANTLPIKINPRVSIISLVKQISSYIYNKKIDSDIQNFQWELHTLNTKLIDLATFFYNRLHLDDNNSLEVNDFTMLLYMLCFTTSLLNVSSNVSPDEYLRDLELKYWNNSVLSFNDLLLEFNPNVYKIDRNSKGDKFSITKIDFTLTVPILESRSMVSVTHQNSNPSMELELVLVLSQNIYIRTRDVIEDKNWLENIQSYLINKLGYKNKAIEFVKIGSSKDRYIINKLDPHIFFGPNNSKFDFNKFKDQLAKKAETINF